MLQWLESMAPGYGVALTWTIVALIGLLVLLIIIRTVRGLTFGTFVAGGRNRKARLAVMDATAVDSQRRLVLVRRDDVEHLILIGGPSDVVVEQNIRLMPQARRPAAAEDLTDHAPVPLHVPVERPRIEPRPAEQTARPVAQARQPVAPPPPTPPSMAAAPVREPAIEPLARPVRTPPPATSVVEPQVAPPHLAGPHPADPHPASPHAARMASVTPPISAPMPSAAPVPPPVAAPHGRDLDDALFEELEVTLEKDMHHPAASPAPHAPEPSLDEEMDRLLSDLAGTRR